MIYMMGDVPVGTYDLARLGKLGIGHGGIDAGVDYTYFDPQTGHELSVASGLTGNFANPDTHYQNGMDWHLDWDESQLLTKQFHIGAVGYVYKQINPDSGAPAIQGGNESQVFGIGPQVGYLFSIGGVQACLNLKAYREFDHARRADGWNLWLTFAITLECWWLSSAGPSGARDRQARSTEQKEPRMSNACGFLLRCCCTMLVCAGVAIAQPAANDGTLIKTESGAVQGVGTGDVISFKGIPYAAPPVHDLRWRVPQPVTPWPGVRSADAFGTECMQPDKVSKSEDCLTLNVWRPAAASAPLPVMVWIYGGALVHGQTSLYPADALARQGVVVVSMNYRMGRLGFFAHPALAAESPDDVRGNYGYMDQRAALRWVQRNIAAFGGDPHAVTLFGESAGGGSVLVHLTAPLSRGLFQRAIIQSPGIPTPRAKVVGLTELSDAEKTAVDYARLLGVTGVGGKALKALRAQPAATFAQGTSAQDEITVLSVGRMIVGFAGAIRDGKLVVETPEVAIAAGHQAMVPVMIGANDRDLGIGSANKKDALFAIFGAYAAEARALYDPRGDQTLDELKQQVFADRTITEPVRFFADQVARAGQPVWLYRFSYVPESQRGTLKGAMHAMEIPYTFDIPAALVGDKVTAADRAMGAVTSAYWVSFAKTGDPNGVGRTVWPRYDPNVDRAINFTNAGVVVGPDPLKARLDLWQKVSNGS